VECPQESIEIEDDTYTVPDFIDEGIVLIDDNCAIATVSQNPVAGTVLGEGTHTIEITVTDTSDNMSRCNFEVLVDDGLGRPEYDIATLTMYPNPAANVVNISNPTGIAISAVVVYDLTG